MTPPYDNVPTRSKPCLVCEEPFEFKRDEAKYCSQLCTGRGRKPQKKDPAKDKAWRDKKRQDPAWVEATRAKAREHSRQVKAWIRAYKLDMGCVDCGYRDHPDVLEFDHQSGKTKNISMLKSVAAVISEIERHGCVVRCANCHRVKTAERRQAARVPEIRDGRYMLIEEFSELVFR